MITYRDICFVCLLGLAVPAWAAADLTRLQAEIDAKSAEIGGFRDQLDRQERTLEQAATELERLREDAEALEQRRAETLATLKEQFERIVADPSLELTGAQQDYRQAFDALAARRDAVAAKEQRISEGERRIAETREAAQRAGETLARLRAGFDRARAVRLFEELNVVGEITLSNTITCEQDETIGGCIARGEDAARALARERFGEQILAAVSEADLVARHRGDDGPAPTLIDSSVMNSGFRGQGDYFVELSARLRNETSQTQACKLLGLSDARCRGEAAAPSAAEPQTETPAVADDLQPEAGEPELVETPEPEQAEDEPDAAGDEQFRLTVRSNVYYDEVFIDGVAYGSTKLDVMLPPGEYDLEVRKPGHRSYRERISLSGNQTVTAELAELAQ